MLTFDVCEDYVRLGCQLLSLVFLWKHSNFEFIGLVCPINDEALSLSLTFLSSPSSMYHTSLSKTQRYFTSAKPQNHDALSYFESLSQSFELSVKALVLFEYADLLC